MTVAQDTPTLQDDFADLKKRVYALEQGRGGNYAADGSASFPNGITIGDSDPQFLDEGVGSPSGLSLSWGSFFDVIFIDASWTAGSGQTQEYEVELVKVGQGVAQVRRTGGTNVRFEPVEPNTQYQVRVRAISRIGVYSAFTAYVNITTGEDSSVPGQVTGLIVSAAFRTMTIRWTERTETDMIDNRGYYEVQIDTVNTFNSGNLRTVRVAGIITTFADLSTSTTYFVRVRAIDSSGNFGAYSSTASATTSQILNAADLAADVVTTVQLAPNAVESANIVDAAIITAKIASLAVAEGNIANAAITNAKIANLAVDDGKIANLSAGKITTSTLTATLTISGAFQTGAANPRVVMDSAGIRLLDSGGRTTLDIAQGAGQPLIKLGRVSTPFHYQILDNAGIRFFKDGSAPFTGGTLAVDLNVNTGSITVDGGTITGSNISATTITGGTVQTSASNPRIALDSINGFRAIDSGGTLKTQIGTDGLLRIGTNARLLEDDWQLYGFDGAATRKILRLRLVADGGGGFDATAMLGEGANVTCGIMWDKSASRYFFTGGANPPGWTFDTHLRINNFLEYANTWHVTAVNFGPGASANFGITFPVAFSGVPRCFLSFTNASGTDDWRQYNHTTSATGTTVNVKNFGGVTGSIESHGIAVKA